MTLVYYTQRPPRVIAYSYVGDPGALTAWLAEAPVEASVDRADADGFTVTYESAGPCQAIGMTGDWLVCQLGGLAVCPADQFNDLYQPAT